MNIKSFSVTIIDVSWAAIAAGLLAAISYHAGVCDVHASRIRALRDSMGSLIEQGEACGKSLSAHRGKPWAISQNEDGEFYIEDLD